MHSNTMCNIDKALLPIADNFHYGSQTPVKRIIPLSPMTFLVLCDFFQPTRHHHLRQMGLVIQRLIKRILLFVKIPLPPIFGLSQYVLSFTTPWKQKKSWNQEVRKWSGWWDSNPRHQPWQGCALPLSYIRLDGSANQNWPLEGLYACGGKKQSLFWIFPVPRSFLVCRTVSKCGL